MSNIREELERRAAEWRAKVEQNPALAEVTLRNAEQRLTEGHLRGKPILEGEVTPNGIFV